MQEADMLTQRTIKINPEIQLVLQSTHSQCSGYNWWSQTFIDGLKGSSRDSSNGIHYDISTHCSWKQTRIKCEIVRKNKRENLNFLSPPMPNYKVFLPVCILVPVTAVLIVPAYLEDNWGNSSENNKRKLNIALILLCCLTKWCIPEMTIQEKYNKINR